MQSMLDKSKKLRVQSVQLKQTKKLRMQKRRSRRQEGVFNHWSSEVAGMFNVLLFE